MAQKDPETGPSLELPSLFGRRKRRAEDPGDPTTTSASAQDSAAEHTAVIPVSEEPVVAEPPPAVPATPAVTPTPVPTSPPARPEESDERPTEVIPPAPATPGATPAGAGRRRAERSGPSIPEMAASTAAFVVGATMGLMGCLLTYVGLQGCELVTGTSSCGGPGLLVLVVILVIMVVVGAMALKRLAVPEAGNVSFLGVGVTTVVALLFLIDYLYDPWMFLIVPAVTALGFLLARWVTTMYADDVMGDQDDDGRPHVDIR